MITQSVEWLLHRDEDLGLIPRTHMKRGVVALTYTTGVGEATKHKRRSVVQKGKHRN